jgi:hypothetical protein
LHEARLAAEIVGGDGDVETLRERVAQAVVWLEDARWLLAGWKLQPALLAHVGYS